MNIVFKVTVDSYCQEEGFENIIQELEATTTPLKSLATLI